MIVSQLGANERVTAATTAGVSRNMQAGMTDMGAIQTDLTPVAQGGGDLNGTAAASILFHQAGTGIAKGQMARLPPNSGNYCGIV